ncbi:aryl-sulfate sulfotransferase [Virgibacillus kekensis]|uniref:Aryl-sulfate sulfotransferase n=1 Tax=Virgibacillus kekensis TaxID=202261 RepID=A0ABV9DH93_9BACI
MKKTLLVFAIVSIFVIAFFWITEYFNFDDSSQSPAANGEPVSFKSDGEIEQLTTYDKQRINEQRKIDQQLKETYQAGTFTLKNPFVTPDPYEVAPLTALMMFKTDQPAKIIVTVEGNDQYGDISHTYEKYSKEHTIPILGLYPDSENTVTIEATTKGGETTEQPVTITTEPLPDDFLTNEVVEARPEKMENGLTFVIPSTRYAYAVDYNGDVRWYSTLWNSHVFQRLDNGNLLYLTKEKGQKQYNELLEMDMLGKVYDSYIVNLEDYPDTNVIHHDAIELPSGNILATVHDMEAPYIEDEMIEIDRETGKTLRDFNYRDIFPEDFYQEYDGPGEDDGDWFHQNAIWYDNRDDTILVSSRHQDLVMKQTYPEGEIKWILAAQEKWPDSYERYLLEPIEEDFKFPGGPHSIMTMPDMDNNKNTYDYLLFDNNVVITRGDDPLSEDFSRMVQYRVNPEKMTVKEVWSYGEERGEAMFSSIVGDANYHKDTGNRMLTSGYIKVDDGRNSRIIETTGEQQAEVVYELVVSGFKSDSHRQAYRAFRLPLHPEKEWNFKLIE